MGDAESAPFARLRVRRGLRRTNPRATPSLARAGEMASLLCQKLISKFDMMQCAAILWAGKEDFEMNFSLTPSLEQFVRDRAASGDYNNASEVVRDAIRLLKRTEERRALKMERLRAAIRDGDAALARGEFTDLDSDRELDEFFAEL